MPRLYVSSSQFSSYPAAMTFPNQVAQINGVSGALDMLLARASRRVDAYCRKRIGAPPTTTVAGNATLSAGSTIVPVASTLGFDNDMEQALVLNPGGANAETLPIVPGGVNVTSWARPYPGTIQLATPTGNAHLVGEAVQGCYQEVSVVGSSASLDSYSESLLALNQEAQIAAAHAPQFATTGLTRVILLKCYPIMNLLALEHMLPIETAYQQLVVSNVGINPASGFLRLPLGSFVLPDGLFRTTYTAGYVNIPDTVMEATSWYAADALFMMYTMGAYEGSQGKMRGKYIDPKTGKSTFVLNAEDLLNNGFKRRT